MSWLSSAKNAFLNLVAGRPANTAIIERPTTTLEKVINEAAGVILPVAAAIPGANAAAVPIEAISAALANAPKVTPAAALDNVAAAIGSSAAKAANGYLSNEIGSGNAELADAALEALASAAISLMSKSSNKTEQDVAAELNAFLIGFHSGAAPAGQAAA